MMARGDDLRRAATAGRAEARLGSPLTRGTQSEPAGAGLDAGLGRAVPGARRRRAHGPSSRLALPWEVMPSWRRRLGLGRWRLWLGSAVVVACVVALGLGERERGRVRRSRQVLDDTRALVDAHLAAEGRCPVELSEVTRTAGRGEAPLDGWGEPLEFRCPDASRGGRYLLRSVGLDAATRVTPVTRANEPGQ